ncbi:bromodomain adjacent to zinc finger domain protein 1A, partial [Asbolus verrucosus]
MPLLKKKPFEKAAMPTFLRDDEEVFFCAATNEIFRDYEDFSERMFLCNSMVWTCSLTGKANLTYAEALESEENARKNLKGFPAELKTPILYLAGKTKRTAFGDMAEDVFTYAKDRYFIGENVETSFTETKWKDSHVLQVIAPSSDNIKVASKNGNVENYHHHPPAALYKYEIEHLDADDEDISEIMIVDYNQIRRKKGMFSRERCKLFLKQHVEQNDKGVFVIKLSTVESYNLNRITFEQIFDGPLPEFDASKKFGKMVNGKKTRQESLHKFLTKSNNDVKNGNNIELLEKIKKREEEYKLHRQQKKEREMALKQKKKEENMLLSKHFKDWYKPKEDLELTDQKKLPIATPVKTNVPDEYFGDMIMVLEFVNSFSKLLSPKDFFPGGLTIEIMERALTKNEVAGPLIDLIQMLLTALFNVQDEEASQYKTEIENPSSIKQEDTSDNMNLREATRLATIASSWNESNLNLSKELDKLEMETKKKKDENERKIEEFRKSSYDKEVVMGQDRALRQYLKLESVPGFFVNFEEKNPGICLNSVIKQNPNLVNATRDETLAHIKKLLQETNSSDKENSPSKNPKKLNDKNYSNGAVVQRTGVMNGQRRCAAKALFKIHDFAKSLRQLSESDDSSEEEVINKRSVRREEGRTDLPLHNAALHEVLSEIMKDYNAWPFLRPVQKTEVPDYYDVITKPMDFGTIKYKLNMGEYQEDAQFMSDALLVFQNCNTYNHTEDDVY